MVLQIILNFGIYFGFQIVNKSVEKAAVRMKYIRIIMKRFMV